MDKLTSFFKASWAEITQHVTWPPFNELQSNTTLVLVGSLIFAFVVGAMGDAIESVLDVTVSYDIGKPSLADLFADRIGQVRVHVRERAIPAEFAGGNYEGDPAFRERFQAWVNGLWLDKDALLESWQTTRGD